MIFSIPIYVEESPAEGSRPGRFVVRPLFWIEPEETAEKLSRALSRLTNSLLQKLKALGENPRHDELAAWTFSPLLEETVLDLRLDLADGTERRQFFCAGYTALDRKIWFTPRLPSLRFEVRPGQTLAEQARLALTRHFRQLEKEGGGVDLDEIALRGKGRLTVIEIELHPAALARRAKKAARAAIFGGEEKMDGERELRRTGRPLHAMYPDDLERAIGRDKEIEELARLLAATDRRPILLVGPRRVGKTAILHELVWQMRSRRKEKFGGRGDLWLISPMRLISGMSYLGQWENRVLAIVEHARDRDYVLYFDDLPGLFAAGVSSASDLNVAQVLKPSLEKREVRVVAEITPESWRILRERDRSLADLFHVIPIEEPSEPETIRVLIEVTRQLEAGSCRFGLEAVPTVYELHRRYAGDAAFPGKAAGFLRRLAARAGSAALDREDVLAEFQQQSGLQMTFLDDRAVLTRDRLVDQLRQKVVGQDHVLEAFTDVLVALKARLNDPRRPLGTLLLLGPTGVGKTQSAKALAHLLFGSEDRLLRFDMNEYVDPGSATRLTGTLREPEGLLTSAIRRQPFSVVLLDEIEKAAPEVYDLLLAVLDEGRLTDAIGRVADFTQTVILLTSNLGVQEARSQLGFGISEAGADDTVFTSAAEKFFRPEFFNRLDRVIPFRSLSREHLEAIARQLLNGVFARDGLQRRNAWLNVTNEAMNRLVCLGYHPELGARALKRVVEREVTQPLAERIAGLPPGASIVANLSVVSDAFHLHLRDLVPEPRTVTWPAALLESRTPARQVSWNETVLAAAGAALDRVEAELESGAPSGRIEMGSLSPAQQRYFYCREQVQKVERLIHAAERRKSSPTKGPKISHLPTGRPVKVIVRQFESGHPRLDRQRAAIALRDAWTELAPETGDLMEIPDSPLAALVRELSLLEAMAAPADQGSALMIFWAAALEDARAVFGLAKCYMDAMGSVLGVTATPLLPQPTSEEILLQAIFGEVPGRIQACYLQGNNLFRLAPGGATTVLAQRSNGSTGLVLMNLIRIASEAEARVHVEELARKAETIEAECFGPLIHRILADGTFDDFRSGLSIPASGTAADFRALWLSTLPLARELQAALIPESEE